jgi:hypothetical protein
MPSEELTADLAAIEAEGYRRAERRMRRYDNMSPERIARRHVLDTRLMLGDSASQAIRFARLHERKFGAPAPPPYRVIRVDVDARGGRRLTPIPWTPPRPCVFVRRHPRRRPRRVARRVARTSGSRGDPPQPGDDEPEPVAVALAGVTA